MKEIKLTKSKIAIVDDEDYTRLSKYKWCLHNNKYARTKINNKNIYMHRYILGARDNQIDHKNGDKLDNRKENLRLCTSCENNRNRTKRINTSSKYKGVSWHIRHKKWSALIAKGNVQYNLGYYTDEIDAAMAYDKKAIELFGEFAKLNFERIN